LPPLPATPVDIGIAAGTFLQHISREQYRGDPLYFGKDAVNRFDDPARLFGTLYLVYDLPTGLMETVFHDHQWHREGARRSIARSELEARMVRIVQVDHDLTLCDLASPGAAVKGFGRNAAQLSARRYSSTQALSATIARHIGSGGQRYDGILYPSRNNPGSACVALFDRAVGKISVADDIRLDDHRDWPSFQRDFSVAVVPSTRRERSGKRP
jgi:hypothetical protein